MSDLPKLMDRVRPNRSGVDHFTPIMNELEAQCNCFRCPSVYPTLQMLKESGYLTNEEEEVEGKRVYTIAESGRQLMQQLSA